MDKNGGSFFLMDNARLSFEAARLFQFELSVLCHSMSRSKELSTFYVRFDVCFLLFVRTNRYSFFRLIPSTSFLPST